MGSALVVRLDLAGGTAPILIGQIGIVAGFARIQLAVAAVRTGAIRRELEAVTGSVLEGRQ